jgi:hypothetical protein
MDEREVVSELVSKLGGAEAVAQAIGAKRDSVWMWSKLGRIPWKWRFTVRRLARERKVTLSPDEWIVLTLEPAKEVTAG